MVHDIMALKTWNEIPKEFKTKILNNVFCTNCRGATTVVDYSITVESGNIIIRGKCKKCNHNIARVLD